MTYNQYEKWKKWKFFYENILGVYKDKTHLNIVLLGIKIKIKNQSQTFAAVERVISLADFCTSETRLASAEMSADGVLRMTGTSEKKSKRAAYSYSNRRKVA